MSGRRSTRCVADSFPLAISANTRSRARLLGPAGDAWLKALPATFKEVCRRWRLTPERQLTGGTEAVVVQVTTGEDERVLKLGLPDSLAAEAAALQIAAGRGYATLYEYDETHQALLLERLGDKLIDSDLAPGDQIEILCETLTEAWQPLAHSGALLTGSDKADWHINFLTEVFSELHEPCSAHIIERALDFAGLRKAAFDPAHCVLGHGDAQSWNTLQVPGTPRYKFVDPDGLFAEKAADLGVIQREWPELLLEGDPLTNGQDRVRLLSQRCQVDEDAIWQWGFIEAVSTGLVYCQLGEPEAAELHFSLAEAWM